MTLDRARELIATQLEFSSGYNRNSVRVLLAEVQREHGMGATDQLIREFELDSRYDLAVGTDFSKVM